MDNKKYQDLLSQMTLEEKASLCSGLTNWLTKPISRLGIPSVWMSDGPHGLRKEKDTGGTNIMQESETSTCFPTAVTTASSWDEDLIREVAETIADEAKALKVTTILGPGVNIKRSPLCGRNFEYMSEDPYLTSKLGTAYVKGAEESGVGVSLKHYCANNQEYLRMCADSVIDERALREIYLPAFERVVKEANPSTVMCSYNRIEGTYLAENKRFLNDILRDEWGFKGIVVSDWGAVNDRIEGIKAGLDLEMPGNGGMNDKHIVEAVENGTLSEEDLDKCVLRMIKFAFECKEKEGKGYKIDFASHHKVARKAAANSAVLLKNNDSLLPLNKHNGNVAVIGELARTLRYQGAGSSHIAPPRTVSFTGAMRAAGQSFTFAPGYTLKGEGYSKKLIDEAVKAAKGKKAVIVFVGLTDAFESEGFDRKHIEMPKSHNILIEELSKVNENIIVVLSCGSPVKIDSWECKVKSILNMYLGGQAGGEAAYDLIFGDVNPSGKLAETFPYNNEDNIVSKYFPMGPRTVEYRESIFVGYRYFDTAKKDVQYPFGHGLSYTKFKYSDLKLSKKKVKEGEKFTVSFNLKNIGDRAGAEVAQVYVSAPESKIFKAKQELKGFKKVYLEKGEEKKVSIELDERAFSFYNVNIKDWQVESGTYSIAVGTSSRNHLLLGEVEVIGERTAEVPDYRESAPIYYDLAHMSNIPDEQFKAVLGREIPYNAEFKKGDLNLNCSVTQVAVSPYGKLLKGILTVGAKVVSLTAENPDMITQSIKDMPLRSFSGFTGGLVSQESVDGLVEMCNGEKGGLRKFIGGFKKK